MKAQRFVIPFFLASLAGHAFILSLAAGIGGEDPPALPIMEVRLAEDTPPDRPLPAPAAPPTSPGAGRQSREDSVSLQGKGGPYRDYLLAIRRRIEGLWRYPPEALKQSQEGDAVIRFTISADGTLDAARVVGTSGVAALDEGALSVVRAAAPYDPLPGSFNLTRLHVTAVFSYRLND